MFQQSVNFILFFLILFSLVPGTAIAQERINKIQPDSSAEQVLSRPDKKKVPSSKLLDVLDQVLKQEQKEQQKRESSLGYEIDGLVVDETLTKTGRDYYDIFYNHWEAPPKVNNYTVNIKERPLRGRGFQIVIEVNGTEINEVNLQPQYDMVEAAALDGVARTQNYLYNYENLQQQLETDDQRGTGLF